MKYSGIVIVTIITLFSTANSSQWTYFLMRHVYVSLHHFQNVREPDSCMKWAALDTPYRRRLKAQGDHDTWSQKLTNENREETWEGARISHWTLFFRRFSRLWWGKSRLHLELKETKEKQSKDDLKDSAIETYKLMHLKSDSLNFIQAAYNYTVGYWLHRLMSEGHNEWTNYETVVKCRRYVRFVWWNGAGGTLEQVRCKIIAVMR